MSDAMDRIAALAGAAISEIQGPVTVNSQTLYGQTPLNWGTSLYNLRTLITANGQPEPIVFAADGGQLELVMGAGPDWRLYAEFSSTWPEDRRFHWESPLAGGGQAQGQIDPVAGAGTWYFATPATGPDGEFVIGITATGAQAPDEAFDIGELRFWLFR